VASNTERYTLNKVMSNSPAPQQRGCGIFYGAIPSAHAHTH